MKKLLLFLLSLCIATGIFSQTLLLDPNGDGGFENGSTFSDNGWTVENYENFNTNKWFVGSASAPSSGSNAAYISNHPMGWHYIYTTEDPLTGSRVLFWRDVTFPAGEPKVTISFKLRINGYPGYDDFAVYVQNSDITPNTSVQPPYAGVIGNFIPYTSRICLLSLYGDGYVHFSFVLNPHDIGNFTESTTRRFIFYWRNDASFGSQPPASVDEISIISEPIDPMIGTYTIDNSMPTSNPVLHNGTSNFNSFSDAFNYININGINGPVTFNVTSSQVFDESPPALTVRGTAVNTITIQKDGGGANPKLIPTGTLSSNPYDFGFCISGGTYITFDGIDVDGSGASTVRTATEYGYLVRNWSAEHGSQYNTIKNCAVTLNPAVINTWHLGCIYSSANPDQGGFIPTSNAGTNSYNKYYNLTLKGSHNGIVLHGGAQFPDMNNEVGVEGEGCQTNRTIITNIGTNFTSSPARGVRALRQNGIKIFNTEISNVRTISMWAQGIVLERCSGVCEVYNNIVSDISDRHPNSESRGVGIEVGSIASDPIIHAKIYNNFVFDIKSSFTGSPSPYLCAIGIYSRVSNESTVEVDNNSVYLYATGSPRYSMACFANSNVSQAVNKVRGNIFVTNVEDQPSPASNVCWFTSSPGNIGAPGSVSDYNNMHIVNPGNGSHTGRGWVNASSSVFYNSLADWTAGTGQDVNSISADPVFYGLADLHASASEVNAYPGFEPQPWVTLDIDCELRSNFTPHDLGADAFNVPTCPIPTSVSISNITFNTADFSWIAPALAVPAGYEWEVRSSGAGGSGPTGLVASGSTIHPTVSASASGLENGTKHFVFVRSDCNGDDSPWANYFFTTTACNAPRNLIISEITKTSANLAWTAPLFGEPQGYEWEVRISGEPGSGANGLVANGSTTHPVVSAIVTDLFPGEIYFVYIRSGCDDSNFSAWISGTFTTVCSNFTLNLLEGFNTTGETNNPDCWTQQFVDGTDPILFKENTYNPVTEPQEGSRFVWWNSFNYLNGKQTRLVSPPITTSGISDIYVSFYWFNNHNLMFSTGNYLQEGMQVQYSLDAVNWTNAGPFIPRHDASIYPGEGAWNLKEINLPEEAGNQPTIYVGFLFRSVRGDNCSMDNLVIWTDLEIIPGDANCDGIVTVIDVITIANYVLGENPEPFCFENADVNGDGVVNLQDLIGTVNIIFDKSKHSVIDVNSEVAHIYLSPKGVDFDSDGTLAGLFFEIEGVNANELDLMLTGYEFVYKSSGDKLTGLLFNFSNTPIPAGKIEIFRFNSQIEDLKWGDVYAANYATDKVQVIKHDEVLKHNLDFGVFPNPSKGDFALKLNLSEDAMASFAIYDMKGREVGLLYEGLLNKGVHHINETIPVNLCAGIYSVKMQAYFPNTNKTVSQYRKVIILD